ncbi:MAG TPA: hypothetical protein VG847_13300 [Chitinophagaceae bacterium]|nr:hypothetical protein [Chitinophagaceae bacterium]
MIFPFKIRLQEVLILKNAVPSEEIFQIIKATVKSESDKAADDFLIDGNTLKFKVHLFRGGRLWSMQAVHSGMFAISKEERLVTLSYNYFIGRAFVFWTVLSAFFWFVSEKDLQKTIMIVGSFWIVFMLLS